MEKKTKKILLLSGLLVALAGAVWYLLFYKPSAYSLARSLGLYTGDPLQDLALDNMIAICLNSTGSISASGNLEWELTDAANRYKNPGMTSGDYWRVNGKLLPAGALLATVDITHDWLAGSPDGTHTIYYDSNGNAVAESVGHYRDKDNEDGWVTSEVVQNENTGGGEGYIPQYDLNKLWDIHNDLKSASE